MKHLVIHKGCIAQDLEDGDLTKKQERRYQAALSIIDRLSGSDVISWPRGNAAGAAEHFQRGESVTLYGAYKGNCLKDAYDALTAKEVNTSYHSIGCVRAPF